MPWGKHCRDMRHSRSSETLCFSQSLRPNFGGKTGTWLCNSILRSVGRECRPSQNKDQNAQSSCYLFDVSLLLFFPSRQARCFSSSKKICIGSNRFATDLSRFWFHSWIFDLRHVLDEQGSFRSTTNLLQDDSIFSGKRNRILVGATASKDSPLSVGIQAPTHSNRLDVYHFMGLTISPLVCKWLDSNRILRRAFPRFLADREAIDVKLHMHRQVDSPECLGKLCHY